MVFLIKIMVPPILVALVSLVQRRWGPVIGGLLMGLPWMTGPVMFFLGLDKGTAFVAGVARGVVTGVYGIAAFMLAWGLMARVAPWWASLAVAAAGYVTASHLAAPLGLPLWLFGALGAFLLMAARWALVPPPAARPVALPWWDIPARMATTLGLVACIMTLAEQLGPQLSGTLATYPVILTVIAGFTHAQGGASAVIPVIRGIAPSLVAFTAFFVVLGYTIERLGLGSAFALAATVALSVSGAFLVRQRMK